MQDRYVADEARVSISSLEAETIMKSTPVQTVKSILGRIGIEYEDGLPKEAYISALKEEFCSEPKWVLLMLPKVMLDFLTEVWENSVIAMTEERWNYIEYLKIFGFLAYQMGNPVTDEPNRLIVVEEMKDNFYFLLKSRKNRKLLSVYDEWEKIITGFMYYYGFIETRTLYSLFLKVSKKVISYEDFKRINESLPAGKEPYKNPRNLASGSVRQLSSMEAAKRCIQFCPFELANSDELGIKTVIDAFSFLKNEGFIPVQHCIVHAEDIVATIDKIESYVTENPLPTDGLVLAYNDIPYGQSLGMTGKFPKHSIAFKWKDDTVETTLRDVEWSASRTGLINPVAIFDTVELEGTRVSRASVHNISIMESLKLGIGDTIQVFKANMIIPQIASNLTQSGNIDIPKKCPVCGGDTQIKEINEVKTLYCTNPDCQAKHVKSFAHFVSRDAMNIDGLSEATLEKFIQKQ